MTASTLRRFRPWVQLLAFLLFCTLLIWAGRNRVLPGDLFYRLDPLVGLAGMLAARQIVAALLVGSAVALLAALLLGRAWCGWLCPLGTLLDWLPSRRSKQFEPDPRPRLRSAKYVLLAAIFIGALFGNLTLLILDPITLIYRVFASVLWPALIALISAAELVFYRVPFLRPAIDAVESNLRGTLLPLEQPAYPAGMAVLLLFLGLLALSAVRERFWCRYLCPLGGLLGLVSKVSWLRRDVGDACMDCLRCARACPTGTVDPAREFASDPAECIMCLECVPVCVRSGQQFRGHWSIPRPGLQPAPAGIYDLNRRQFLAAAGGATLMVGLFAAEASGGPVNPYLVRPPGADPARFPSQCVRCGICIKACPTSGLQPSSPGPGWSEIWAPVLVARLGHCDYGCNTCGQSCPTNAIPALTLEEKRLAVMGHAYIDRDRCIPWTDNRICLVCEEMCPLPEKAIILEDVRVTGPDGATVDVRRPHVVRDRCIGCGICENRCPLQGEAAIRVFTPTDLSGIGYPA